MLPAKLKPKKLYDLIRLGKNNDGGYLVCKKSIKDSKLLFSFGISDDISFEEDFKKKNNSQIIAFDPTSTNIFFFKKIISNLIKLKIKDFIFSILNFYNFKRFFNIKNNLFIKKKIGIGGSLPFHSISFDEILNLSKGNKDIFFKIDIEGSEYRILDDLIKNSKLIVGLAIEFHDVDINLDKILHFIEKIDLKLIHIHPNNYAGLGINNIPSILELTFSRNPVKVDDNLNLPHNLDQKNNPNSNDIDIFFNE
jgi:hypothetical protein